MAPRVTPAASATSASEAWPTPRSRNTCSAASSTCSRVSSASSFVLLAITPHEQPAPRPCCKHQYDTNIRECMYYAASQEEMPPGGLFMINTSANRHVSLDT